MFTYQKTLQYPVKIATPNPKLAAMIISQYGGPDGELGASMRYLSQRYAMPYPELAGLLTDIGTVESSNHLFCLTAITPERSAAGRSRRRTEPSSKQIVATSRARSTMWPVP